MIRSRSLIWYLFPSYLLVIVPVLLVMVWLVSVILHDFYYNEKKLELEAAAKLTIERLSLIDSLEQEDLNELCGRLSQVAGARVTLIDGNGVVRSDSHADPQFMDNHSDRPEIIMANQGETGSRKRYSFTLGEEVLYLALPARLAGKDYVVRTSLPTSKLKHVIRRIQHRILLGGLVTLILAALISYLLARKISRPIDQIQRAAERFAAGDLEHPLYMSSTREFDSLAQSLNMMARQQDARIKTVLQQRDELQALLSSMIEGVIAVDAGEKIINLNQAAAALFDRHPNDLIGEALREKVRSSEFILMVEQILQQNVRINDEFQYPKPSGRVFQVTGVPLRFQDESRRGAVLVLHDVTEIRQMEENRKQFAANVSHELRTPLTSITGYVETLLAGAKNNPEDATRFLEIIARHAERMNNIITELLELTRIEQMQYLQGGFLTESTDLVALVQDAIRDAVQQTDTPIDRVHLTEQQPVELEVNSPLLKQALINLLHNALKFSPPDQPVRVRLLHADGQVRFEVEDQGPGIAVEHHERLFERFYRVDKARDRAAGGTGLGLAIVKHVILLHGGAVSVSSCPGEGATFIITLPAPISA